MGSQRVVAGPLQLTHTHTHTHVIGLCFRLPRMRHMVTKEIHTVWRSKGAVQVDLAWISHVPVW